MKKNNSSTEKAITRQERKKLNMIDKYTPAQLNELLKIITENKKLEINEIISTPDYLKLWVVADKHYNDRECDETAIDDLYSLFNSKWVDAVVDAWDMTAGIGVYKWQMFDLLNHSFEDQLKHIALKHPTLDNGKKTYAINGNHDMSWNDVAGINFWQELQKIRPDIVNIGSYQWQITLNNILIWLQHWSKWLPYAVSYHLQKYIEKIPQWKEPHLYVLWHYHNSLMMDYHGIMCFLPWAFQRWNLLTKRMGLSEDNIWWYDLEIIKEWNKIHINPTYHRF